MASAKLRRSDSLNLALAVNLKGVLKEGLDDKDVEVKVDKTVVFINLSDNVLFKKGSSEKPQIKSIGKVLILRTIISIYPNSTFRMIFEQLMQILVFKDY